jgi:hypothetical protein
VHHDTNCGMGYLGSKMIARSVISNHLRTVICGIHVIVWKSQVQPRTSSVSAPTRTKILQVLA